MEEQIREHEGAIIKLKRARNSLLNVSKLSPEVLGDIFRRNVTLKEDFDGLEEGSRNFLLVCNHWYEVALRTPEVWSFWGNTTTDWARWHRYSGTAPLDLVLSDDDYHEGTVDNTLSDVLRDRATRDTIRRVHLCSIEGATFLSSIITSLTTASGIWSNRMESIILLNTFSGTPVDVSDFFIHYRFPKLQRLELHNCRVTSWDLLTSRAAVLTSLILDFKSPSPTPTTSQLLSVLASNPSLRTVSLSKSAVPDDGGGKPSFRVPLNHLKELEMAGDSRHVIGLLYQLDHPTNVDLDVTLCDRTDADIPRIVGPYLRDYVRRRDRSQNGLGLYISRLEYRVADVGGLDLSTKVWEQIDPFVTISMKADQTPHGPSGNPLLDLVPHLPQDEVVYFRPLYVPAAMEDMSTRFPNLRALHPGLLPLTAVFLGPDPGRDGGIPTSLQHIILEWPYVEGDDWSPLTNSLAHRASSGNRLDSLTLHNPPRMCPKLEEDIRSMVRELRIT